MSINSRKQDGIENNIEEKNNVQKNAAKAGKMAIIGIFQRENCSFVKV